jgi:hypothetical protein
MKMLTINSQFFSRPAEKQTNSLFHSPSLALVYAEYFQIYNRMLDPDLQYRLARTFHKQGNFEGAARSLEMVIAEPVTSKSTREQVFVQLITILAEKGLMEAAQFRCRQFGEAFPQSTLLKRAQEISKSMPQL